MVIRKLTTGLTPLMLDKYRLRIEEGLAAVSGSNPDVYIDVSSNTVLDIRGVGPWGLDRGLWVGWAYLWGIADSSGVNPGACILSPSNLGGGVNIPSGYDRIRYLPYAVYIQGSTAGMRLQLVTAWPYPCTVLYQDQSTAHEIVVPSTAGAWVSVDLSNLISGDARVAYLSIEAVTIYGAGGSVQVRTPGSGDGGPYLNSPNQTTKRIAVSSSGKIEVRTATAAYAKIRVLGYETLTTY